MCTFSKKIRCGTCHETKNLHPMAAARPKVLALPFWPAMPWAARDGEFTGVCLFVCLFVLTTPDSLTIPSHRGPEHPGPAGQYPHWCNLGTGCSAAAQSGHRTQGSAEFACKWHGQFAPHLAMLGGAFLLASCKTKPGVQVRVSGDPF